ncbi:MAG: hypothetical protein J6O49_08270, partial [Bacteroidaceae bacterium]|nr:hypothetical protein [Bacteroidaceae bacterium]
LNKKPYVWCYYSVNEDGNTISNTRYTSSSSPYSMYDVNNICEDVFGHLLNGEGNGGGKKKIQLKKMASSNRVGYVTDQRVAPVEPFNPYDNAGRGINFDPAVLGELGLDPGEPIGTLDHPVEAPTFEQRVEEIAARVHAFDGMNGVRVENLQPVDYTVQYNIAATAVPTIAVATTTDDATHE